jgi:hypothetical protein
MSAFKTLPPSPIIDRLEVAFERARWRFPESPPKIILLTEEDWTAYDEAIREQWPSAVRCFSYRDVQIRSGNRSRLITKHGCPVAIPRQVSARTLEQASPSTRAA